MALDPLWNKSKAVLDMLEAQCGMSLGSLHTTLRLMKLWPYKDHFSEHCCCDSSNKLHFCCCSCSVHDGTLQWWSVDVFKCGSASWSISKYYDDIWSLSACWGMSFWTSLWFKARIIYVILIADCKCFRVYVTCWTKGPLLCWVWPLSLVFFLAGGGRIFLQLLVPTCDNA